MLLEISLQKLERIKNKGENFMRCVGVTSRGVRLPVLKTGDNLRQIDVDSVLKA